MQRTTINPAAIPEINFDNLPPELKLHVLNKLELSDLQAARKVSTEWCSLYSAVRKKDLAAKTLNFLRKPDCHLQLTTELLRNIVNIISDSPLSLKDFYYALRNVRDVVAHLSINGDNANKVKLKVSVADLQNCMAQAFGVAAFFDDTFISLLLTQAREIKLYAQYFAPFVVLRDLLLQGGGKLELEIANEIYTRNLVERIYFANNELNFVLRTMPEQALTLSEFINITMGRMLNEDGLSKLKASINQFAAGIRSWQQNLISASKCKKQN